MTGERGKTIRMILSNGRDDDLSVVDGDVGWSPGEVDCIRFS